jgi:hypothetical protein
VARSDLVKALLRSYQQGDDAAFKSAAEAVITDERRKRHDLLADELTAILADSPGDRGRRRPLQVSSLKPLPKTRDDHPLLTLVQPRTSFSDLVLADSVTSVLDGVVDEFRQRSVLRAHGVSPRTTLLPGRATGNRQDCCGRGPCGGARVSRARIQLATVCLRTSARRRATLSRCWPF